MADDMPSPPLVYEGLDPNPESRSTIAEVSDAVRGAANRVGDAIEKGKNPACRSASWQHCAGSAARVAAGRVLAGSGCGSAALRREIRSAIR